MEACFRNTGVVPVPLDHIVDSLRKDAEVTALWGHICGDLDGAIGRLAVLTHTFALELQSTGWP